MPTVSTGNTWAQEPILIRPCAKQLSENGTATAAGHDSQRPLESFVASSGQPTEIDTANSARPSPQEAVQHAATSSTLLPKALSVVL